MEPVKENGHDPENDVRKIIYDCIDQRVTNPTSPNTPTWLIINQHGFLGQIEELKDVGVVKYRGYINPWSNKILTHDFGFVEAGTFDECIKELTRAHVAIYHYTWKLAVKEGRHEYHADPTP